MSLLLPLPLSPFLLSAVAAGQGGHLLHPGLGPPVPGQGARRSAQRLSAVHIYARQDGRTKRGQARRRTDHVAHHRRAHNVRAIFHAVCPHVLTGVCRSSPVCIALFERWVREPDPAPAPPSDRTAGDFTARDEAETAQLPSVPTLNPLRGQLYKAVDTVDHEEEGKSDGENNENSEQLGADVESSGAQFMRHIEI